MNNIEPFDTETCTLVKDISHDKDLCQIFHVNYLSPRQVRTMDQSNSLKPLGLQALRYLIEFPEYVERTGEKIVFSGVSLRNIKGSPLPYHPTLIVNEHKGVRTVEVGHILEISLSSEFHYVAALR
jgi:hypothetical protein